MKGQVQKVSDGYFKVADESAQKLWMKMGEGDVCDVALMTPTQKRSVEQNALQHKHYGEIGKFHGMTPNEAKNFCKYTYAMPILIRDDPERMEYFKLVLSKLEYEDRIKAMEHIDASSLLDKKQACEYTDTIVREQAKQGLYLTLPGEG